MLAKVQPAQTIPPSHHRWGGKSHSFILKWEKWDTFQETFHCALSYNQTAQTNLKITNLLRVPTFCKHFMDENCRKALHVAAMPSLSGNITLQLLVVTPATPPTTITGHTGHPIHYQGVGPGALWPPTNIGCARAISCHMVEISQDGYVSKKLSPFFQL